MALSKCRECGDKVAKSAKTCPHCGVGNPDKGAAAGAWVGKLLIVSLFGAALYSCVHAMNDTPSAVANDGHLDALMLCQQTIMGAAKNPSSAKVPYAKDYGSESEHYFAWAKGSGLTLMNGFGANVDTSASCVTSGDGKTITSLTIDGKEVR